MTPADPRAVLVVDDDEDIRHLVTEVLRLSGFVPSSVSSGVEALRLLRRAHPLPSLVLLDVQMPELDGWDTLRAIRTDPHATDVPVVLCTVKASPLDAAVGWALGCDGYIVKPFAISELIDEVETVLAADFNERVARRRNATRQVAEAHLR